MDLFIYILLFIFSVETFFLRCVGRRAKIFNVQLVFKSWKRHQKYVELVMISVENKGVGTYNIYTYWHFWSLDTSDRVENLRGQLPMVKYNQTKYIVNTKSKKMSLSDKVSIEFNIITFNSF